LLNGPKPTLPRLLVRLGAAMTPADQQAIAAIIADTGPDGAYPRTFFNNHWREVFVNQLADYMAATARSTAPHLCDCGLSYLSCHEAGHQFDRDAWIKEAYGEKCQSET
jgi:hypothetical protein